MRIPAPRLPQVGALGAEAGRRGLRALSAEAGCRRLQRAQQPLPLALRLRLGPEPHEAAGGALLRPREPRIAPGEGLEHAAQRLCGLVCVALGRRGGGDAALAGRKLARLVQLRHGEPAVAQDDAVAMPVAQGPLNVVLDLPEAGVAAPLVQGDEAEEGAIDQAQGHHGVLHDTRLLRLPAHTISEAVEAVVVVGRVDAPEVRAVAAHVPARSGDELRQLGRLGRRANGHALPALAPGAPQAPGEQLERQQGPLRRCDDGRPLPQLEAWQPGGEEGLVELLVLLQRLKQFGGAADAHLPQSSLPGREARPPLPLGRAQEPVQLALPDRLQPRTVEHALRGPPLQLPPEPVAVPREPKAPPGVDRVLVGQLHHEVLDVVVHDDDVGAVGCSLLDEARLEVSALDPSHEALLPGRALQGLAVAAGHEGLVLVGHEDEAPAVRLGAQGPLQRSQGHVQQPHGPNATLEGPLP
mmetsp:Transcript_80939/g.262144  ORF Transcript_80939/g.262144 Transcript_80939/m.262144 type:complete len:469 (-) Transcript_80939:385-1791(-)